MAIGIHRGGGAITPDPEPDTPTTYTITITGANSYAYAEINGITYNTDPSQTLSLSAGTQIKITVNISFNNPDYDGPIIKLDGVTVQEKAGSYTLTLNNNYNIVGRMETDPADSFDWGVCEITTIS